MTRYLLAPLLALSLILGLTLTTLPQRAAAQQAGEVYVQIQALPNLADARQAISYYEGYLSDVKGFSLGNGFYAIALGPYTRGDAGQVLRVLRAEGRIPPDSYIAYPSWFAEQIYPPGAAPAAPPAPAGTAEATPKAAPEVAELPALPDESPAEARRSEAQLSRAERDQLQIALDWAGVYNGAIDGAFGRGTRSAMAAWQRNNGHEPSGVLTTAQRAELLGQYNAILDGLGLASRSDARAGIRMDMPLGVVDFDRYQAPFAFYTPSGELDAQLILISQEGDQETLFGLYDILQTLQIVPEDGPRQRNSDSFRIEGRSSRVVTHAEASLEGGEIKGFVLVWPAGDSQRRTRLLEQMQASFTRTPGVLPHDAGAGAEQSVDLVSGLEIRKPLKGRSGVYVAEDGAVLTLASAVSGCGRVTVGSGLDDGAPMKIAATDPATGLALLRPVEASAPMAVARIATMSPRISSEIVLAGYSYEGLLGAPSVSWGTLADVRGLSGEEGISRLDIATLPGDAGGPVFDSTGALVGLLTAPEDSNRQLPEGVAFAVAPLSLAEMLTGSGVSPVAASGSAPLTPNALTRHAQEVTVLVQCWE
ncbi:Putative peptidoglycan binding domain-containing protein [Pseudooceanicola antarcticus]|uniref:Peptidoglycan-binding protein n=1 Tax=Pseudooceanicola antarcticus TaxID=1247613 RepID=A0A285IUE5_9RHOB|nr:trypsin-like peptidase domain-containing protein [Pseudooceanicola antarcticus]PJE32071.1 peptidoglycan-binding protein [Pseudooceanicola antarcticus]SNY51453.1 Putative peptidoglycan binding domain-containing protein [Pseudooceanicola antarcticus]